MDPHRRLTRHEFDAVIRRATELAAREGESGDLSEEDLLRIAGDVGLEERHVRRALTELRTGVGLPQEAGLLGRVFGPETVAAHRTVPGTPRELAEILDEFLVAGRLLQSVRSGERILQYRPAVDWASQVARAAASTSRRYYVASARSVEVRFEAEEGGDRTRVELEVDPGTRGDNLAGAAAGAGVAGGAAGAGVGFLVFAMAPLLVAVVAGVVVGAPVAAGAFWAFGRSHRRKLGEVRAEVEGILDQLEAGERPEPPPPSWLRWVKRQFHGARRLLEEGGELDR